MTEKELLKLTIGINLMCSYNSREAYLVTFTGKRSKFAVVRYSAGCVHEEMTIDPKYLRHLTEDEAECYLSTLSKQLELLKEVM